jgi:hypothetical protein
MFITANASTDEFNEFNSFDSYSKNNSGREKYERSHGGRNNFSPMRSIAVIAIAAVIILAIIIISALASSGSKGILYKDNAYIVYEDNGGNTFVSVNGNTLDASFEGTVTLHEAKDRSFAYIEEVFDKQYNIYILENKKMTPVTLSPATDILAYAEYEVGVVYKDGNEVYLFTEDHGEELITNDETAKNFKISGDGKTVAFTKIDVENGNKINLFIFTAGKSTEKATSACYPAAVSYDGEYVYCYGYTKTDKQKKLYVMDTDNFDRIAVGTGVFGDIIAMNSDGDEIIYYTVSTNENGATENTSHVYSVRKEAVHTIAKGFFVPTIVDPDIACPATFKDTYVNSASSESEGSTYYINRKYVPSKIASYIGTFSPDGDYFYYLNLEAQLVQVDLNDKGYAASRVLSDVTNYAVTQKGNIYAIDVNSTLRFLEIDDNKKTKISETANELVMYGYANLLYFTENDSVSVLSTKEGSSKDAVKFDKAALAGLPKFKYDGNSKNYVLVYDSDIGWKIFYTSNGKKFKLVMADCNNIDGGIYE